MNRRDFCLATPLLLAGCGAGDTDMAEYTLQPSPKRVSSAINASVPSFGIGTWTPSVGGTATYSSLNTFGRYARIGQLVFIEGAMQITAIGTGSTTTISGLPFASIPLEGGVNTGNAIAVGPTTNLATNVVSIDAYVLSSFITFSSRTAAAASSTTNALWQNGSIVLFSGWYFTRDPS